MHSSAIFNATNAFVIVLRLAAKYLKTGVMCRARVTQVTRANCARSAHRDTMEIHESRAILADRANVTTTSTRTKRTAAIAPPANA